MPYDLDTGIRLNNLERRVHGLERALKMMFDLHSCGGMRANPMEPCPICAAHNAARTLFE